METRRGLTKSFRKEDIPYVIVTALTVIAFAAVVGSAIVCIYACLAKNYSAFMAFLVFVNGALWSVTGIACVYLQYRCGIFSGPAHTE